MDDETEAKLTIINRLLAAFPATSSGSSDDVVDAFLIGCAEIPAHFLAIAAQRFLAGTVPGQHSTFSPSPAQLATTAREHWYMALETEHKKLPPPPEPPEPSPEERARVKAGFDALIADLASKVQTEDAKATARRKALQDKTNARFQPDMSDEAVTARLGGRPRYSVGDPEDAADAA
jgi:hypothetical protein